MNIYIDGKLALKTENTRYIGGKGYASYVEYIVQDVAVYSEADFANLMAQGRVTFFTPQSQTGAST